MDKLEIAYFLIVNNLFIIALFCILCIMDIYNITGCV